MVEGPIGQSFGIELSPQPIPLCDVGLLENHPPPLVVDGLLRQGQIALIGGHSKKWKSWALRDLLFCVANGLEWLGFPTAKALVIDIDLELEPWDIRSRYEQIAMSYGVVGSFDNIKVSSMRGTSLSPAQLEALPTQLGPLAPSLVSIDPVYRLLVGHNSENDTGAITTMMNRLLAVATALKCAIPINHHFSKGNQADKEAIDRFSGTGVWGRHPDCLITFTEHENEDSFTVNVLLRSFPRIAPFVVKFLHPRFRIQQDADPEALKRQKGGRPTVSSVDQICSLIPAGETIPLSELFRKASRFEISKSSVIRRLREGKIQGFLYQDSDKAWGLTLQYLKKNGSSL